MACPFKFGCFLTEKIIVARQVQSTLTQVEIFEILKYLNLNRYHMCL